MNRRFSYWIDKNCITKKKTGSSRVPKVIADIEESISMSKTKDSVSVYFHNDEQDEDYTVNFSNEQIEKLYKFIKEEW